MNRSDRCDHPGHHPGQGGQPGQGGRGAVARRRLDDSASHKNRHRLDRRRNDLPIVLRHDNDPHRLDTATAPAKISSIFGCHRPGRNLLLQTLDHDFRPASAQHSLNLALIHAIMRDQHQRGAIATGHASAADFAPSIPAPCRPIAHIAQCTSQPSHSVRQTSRRIDPHDGKARRCGC